MNRSYSYKPVRFFIAAFLVTWTAWFIAAYFSYRQDGNMGRWFAIAEISGLFGPFLAAAWMISASGSKELKRNFYERLFNLKLIRLSSIPGIFLIMPLSVVISVLISHLAFGQPLEQLRIVNPAPVGPVPVTVMFFGAALFEELGWKGYGMDSLRGRRTFFGATLIYASLWALWHIPLFFINNYYHNTLFRTNPLFALNFFLSVFPAAFIINWLWYKNKGSILTAVLFHAVANSQGILPAMGQTAKCVQTVVLIIIAAAIIASNKKIFFEKFPAQIGYFGR